MPKNWVLRATQLRTVSQLDRAIQEGTVSALRQALPYSCDLELLGADLAIAFVQLSPTERTLDFLRSNPPHTLPAAWARALVGLFVSNTDANAALAMYSMHVLDTHSAAILLDIPWPRAPQDLDQGQRSDASRAEGMQPLRLLDVGAGDGAVTAELAPLFSEVMTTEVSRPCVRAICKRGFACTATSDLAVLTDMPQWDVVSCFNVLDRCSCPLDLLAGIRRLTKPQSGRVLLAVVLPFRPFVECGALGRRQDPKQRLPVTLMRRRKSRP